MAEGAAAAAAGAAPTPTEQAGAAAAAAAHTHDHDHKHDHKHDHGHGHGGHGHSNQMTFTKTEMKRVNWATIRGTLAPLGPAALEHPEQVGGGWVGWWLDRLEIGDSGLGFVLAEGFGELGCGGGSIWHRKSID